MNEVKTYFIYIDLMSSEIKMRLEEILLLLVISVK